EASPAGVLHHIIVPGRCFRSAPPFRGDSFRPSGKRDLMRYAAPSELPRRSFRNDGNDVCWLRARQQHQRTCGRWHGRRPLGESGLFGAFGAARNIEEWDCSCTSRRKVRVPIPLVAKRRSNTCFTRVGGGIASACSRRRQGKALAFLHRPFRNMALEWDQLPNRPGPETLLQPVDQQGKVFRRSILRGDGKLVLALGYGLGDEDVTRRRLEAEGR